MKQGSDAHSPGATFPKPGCAAALDVYLHSTNKIGGKQVDCSLNKPVWLVSSGVDKRWKEIIKSDCIVGMIISHVVGTKQKRLM